MFVDLGRSIVRNPPRLSLTVNVARRCHGLGYLAIAHFRLSTDKSRTTFYRYHTMRRMMHAAAILLAIATQVQAQYASTVSSIETPPSLQPDLSQSAEVNNELEMSDPTAKQLVHQQRHSGTQFIPREAGRNYSQLASYMSCNDWSPNLWNNYACERAAIAARISQHVDMQCKCFEAHHGKLHSQASGCGACDEGKCIVGTGPKLINRYRQPVSTLRLRRAPVSGGRNGIFKVARLTIWAAGPMVRMYLSRSFASFLHKGLPSRCPRPGGI